MEKINNSSFKNIVCKVDGIGIVQFHEKTIEHIKNDHPEVDIDHVRRAVEDPKAIYKDHVRKNHLNFIGKDKILGGGHHIKVPVKNLGSEGKFVATGFYDRKPQKGFLMWIAPEKTDGS